MVGGKSSNYDITEVSIIDVPVIYCFDTYGSTIWKYRYGSVAGNVLTIIIKENGSTSRRLDTQDSQNTLIQTNQVGIVFNSASLIFCLLNYNDG